MLLPFGRAEIEPSFSYTRREDDAPVFFFENGQAPQLADLQQRRNEYEVAAALRIGLPFDAQIEFGLPYRIVNRSDTVSVVFADRQQTEETGQGIGDLSVGVAKTLMREHGFWPDVVARFTWDTDTGQTKDNGVALGNGFNELQGSLSAVKRLDPLAFVVGASYETTFEKNNVDPGDQVAFSVGAVLATSPETSLRVSLNQSFAQETEVNGDKIDGSDQVNSTLTLGGSAIVGPNTLLDLAVGVGLTEDAPDYSVRVSLPIRFGLPFK